MPSSGPTWLARLVEPIFLCTQGARIPFGCISKFAIGRKLGVKGNIEHRFFLFLSVIKCLKTSYIHFLLNYCLTRLVRGGGLLEIMLTLLNLGSKSTSLGPKVNPAFM